MLTPLGRKMLVLTGGLFIAVASFLITTVALNYWGTPLGAQRSPDEQRLSDMQNLQKALESYFKDHAVYPATPAAIDCQSPYNDVGNLSGVLSPHYITAIPKDPHPESCAYNYLYWSDTKSYSIMVRLDHIDPDKYGDRWCIGAASGSIAGGPAVKYLPCP